MNSSSYLHKFNNSAAAETTIELGRPTAQVEQVGQIADDAKHVRVELVATNPTNDQDPKATAAAEAIVDFAIGPKTSATEAILRLEPDICFSQTLMINFL
jgi:hypothetical protein